MKFVASMHAEKRSFSTLLFENHCFRMVEEKSSPLLTSCAFIKPDRVWSHHFSVCRVLHSPHMSWLNLAVLNPTAPCCITVNLYLSPPCLESWPSQKAVHHQRTARPVMLHLELITPQTPADRLSWLQTKNLQFKFSVWAHSKTIHSSFKQQLSQQKVTRKPGVPAVLYVRTRMSVCVCAHACVCSWGSTTKDT